MNFSILLYCIKVEVFTAARRFFFSLAFLLIDGDGDGLWVRKLTVNIVKIASRAAESFST